MIFLVAVILWQLRRRSYCRESFFHDEGLNNDFDYFSRCCSCCSCRALDVVVGGVVVLQVEDRNCSCCCFQADNVVNNVLLRFGVLA